MKTLLIISLLLSLTSFPGWSAERDKGVAAFENGDFTTALKELTPLAEQGDAEAQFNLGYMYRTGEGVPQDDKTAVEWYTLAAEQGLDEANRILILMYLNGEDAPQDYINERLFGIMQN